MGRIWAVLEQFITASWRCAKSAVAEIWSRRKPKWLLIAGVGLLAVFIGLKQRGDYQEHVLLGQNALNIGDYAAAKTYFDEALADNPLQRVASLLVLVAGKDNKDEAKEAIQNAVEILPFSDAAQLGRRKAGVLALRSADRKPDTLKIKQELDLLAQQYPRDADIQTLFGKFYLSFLNNPQKMAQARRAFEQAKAFNPQAAEAYFGLCEIADLQRNPQQAMDDCRKAVEIAEQLIGGAPSKYVLNLAILQVENGHGDDGLITLQHGNLQSEPSVLFELGRLHLLVGQWDKAMGQLQAAVLVLDKSESAATDPLYFKKADGQPAVLQDANAKKCYEGYLSALGESFKRQPDSAKSRLSSIASICGPHLAVVKQIVRRDIEILKTFNFEPAIAGNFQGMYLD